MLPCKHPVIVQMHISSSPQFSRKFGDFIDCCLDLSKNPPLKSFSQILGSNARRQKLRVRQPAHLLNEEAAVKLSRAYALARALPPEDGHSPSSPASADFTVTSGFKVADFCGPSQERSPRSPVLELR